jgi:hypothetical protein
MATDKQEPRVGLIVKIAGLAIVSFVVIRFGLTSYFHWMEDDVRAERQAKAQTFRVRPGDDEGTRGAIQASVDRFVKSGEAALVKPVVAEQDGGLSLPCWLGQQCEDQAPATSAPPKTEDKPREP